MVFTLDRWFGERGILPRIVAEFEDSALSKVFAREGLGFVALPRFVSEEAIAENGFAEIGEASGCREMFYALTLRRPKRRAAVDEILAGARARLSRH